MKDKIITLLQTIINKIRGLQMTAPIPQEEYTEYLEDVIGVVNDSDLDVPNELPDTTGASVGDVLGLDSDKNPAWITPSSGGGVLVVTDTDGTLNKTWQEINDADFAVILAYRSDIGATVRMPVELCPSVVGYEVICAFQGASILYAAESASGYPTLDE